ncbi:Carcinoembryonic antigen-related cell adhesion molecule-like protein [Emericellopsis cladophorae]|uniref:Carcinoembryonic antigen-related cell adhesion molecule-like protein n=1 Tax=Emericellopsis cladophorae TaxID=2686198 RepID=A0A9P9Y8C3_9HYPO|nr:Carcinoembryonic antigen-related cell adhesion molecule-like protein [Emericellopsis cladophorae]KAI6785412.1 Carcinoembryonic antigen-related cell adhesion molecule-like protein [Emericellopsis cladophorae]
MQPNGTTRRHSRATRAALIALLSVSPAIVTAQSEECVSLEGSSLCSSWQSASFSRSQDLTNDFPFLEFVTDRESFDREFSQYLKTTYIRDKYQRLFDCSGIDLTDSQDCASFLTSDRDLCPAPNDNLAQLIRADFVTCHLPDDSLGENCINPANNGPDEDNCGFGNSTIGLCWHCSEGGANSTETCCYNSNAEERCQGVELPVITSTLVLESPTRSSEPENTSSSSGEGDSGNGNSSGNEDDDDSGGLSGGAIAGIVVGTLAGIALIAAALFFCIRRSKRREGSQHGSIFNQPSPSRGGARPMSQAQAQEAPQGYEILPGGRIARGAAAAGAAAGYMGGRRKDSNTQSSSDEYAESEPRTGILRPPPSATRRNGSLSSNSIFGTSVPQSPASPEGFSSPPGVSSQQSEQLPFFKDYYSQDDIHPGDRVAVLWAYQPRATDEFTLERGDMLKVVGIWDDGWATGIMIDERADDWDIRRQAQRDSGVSHASGRRDSSPSASGEIKAFPLVCVCMPDHWRKTIEGDGSTDVGSNANHPLSGQM